MNWREVAVTVSSQGEEAVADLFYQVGCPGVTIEDPQLLHTYIEAGVWDYHEFNEVNITGTSIVKGYLAEDNDLERKLIRFEAGIDELLHHFPDWVIQVKGACVKEEDWANAWKVYFKPIKVGKRFMIKPSWEDTEVQEGDVLIEIDPGMAFGTGTHTTTTLCLEALEDIVKPGHKVYDLGTGSGILAIGAAKLGAQVEGVDLDSVAVKVARENVLLNHIEDRVKIHQGDLGTVLNGQADVVVANIIADVILALLKDLERILKPAGQFIASGIIASRADEVRAGIIDAGLEIIECREEGTWVMIHASRPM